MKETFRLIFTLFIICLIAGGLLAKVNSLTEGPIAQAALKKKQDAIREVLPPAGEELKISDCVITNAGQIWTFYVGSKDGKYIGTAVETVSHEGYGGDIKLMLGINADGKSQAISILKQTETPGLGANIETKSFKGNFVDKDLKTTKWQVKKDGGDIDQITAATISSRAVTGAVKAAIEAYLANEETIKAKVTK